MICRIEKISEPLSLPLFISEHFFDNWYKNLQPEFEPVTAQLSKIDQENRQAS